jgi:predicted MFS family arabinose efflux permease
MVYPLVQGREHDWPAWCFGMIAGSVVLLAVFVVYQLQRHNSGKTTLIELSIFTKRAYVSGVVFVMVFFGTISGFALSVGLFLQVGLGYSPMGASAAMVSWSIGAFLGSGFAATTMQKLGRTLLHVGLVIMTAGAALLYFVFAHYGAAVGAWDLVLPLLVFGTGMGMIFVPLFDIIMAGVEDHEVGSASSVLESLQQLGASLGVAVLGTVFFSAVGAHVGAEFRAAAVHGAERVALISAGLAVLTFAISFLLPSNLRSTTAHLEQEGANEPTLVAV